MTDEFFPPVTPEPDSSPQPSVEDAVEPVLELVQPPQPVVVPEPVPTPVIQTPVGITQEAAAASAQDPTTPSPFKPNSGVCGHCGNADSLEPQSHFLFCYKCGGWSDVNGYPIQGNPHARANVSETFPWANAL